MEKSHLFLNLGNFFDKIFSCFELLFWQKKVQSIFTFFIAFFGGHKSYFVVFCSFISADKRTFFLLDKNFNSEKKKCKVFSFFYFFFGGQKSDFIVFCFLFRQTMKVFQNGNPEYFLDCCLVRQNGNAAYMRFGVSGGRRAFPHLLFIGHLLFRAENTFIGNSSYLHLW